MNKISVMDIMKSRKTIDFNGEQREVFKKLDFGQGEIYVVYPTDEEMEDILTWRETLEGGTSNTVEIPLIEMINYLIPKCTNLDFDVEGMDETIKYDWVNNVTRIEWLKETMLACQELLNHVDKFKVGEFRVKKDELINKIETVDILKDLPNKKALEDGATHMLEIKSKLEKNMKETRKNNENE